MRRSRTATAALTGLIGLGTMISLALPANADTPAQTTKTKIATTGSGGTTGGFSGPIVAYPVTPTTAKPQLPKAPPAPADADDLVLTGIPADPTPHPKLPEGTVLVDGSGGQDHPCAPLASCPQDGECIPGTTVDPDCRPDDDCKPIPGAADCPETEDECDDSPNQPRHEGDDCDEDCVPIPGTSGHNCPETEDDCDDTPSAARTHRDDPCRDDECETRPDQPRVNATTGSTGGTGGQTTGTPGGDHPLGRPERCPGDTDGGTTGGTTGGETRLPRTGTEIMTIAAAGLGLTGFGAALRRIGRRSAT